MVFWRDRRLGDMLDQIEQQKGHSSAGVLDLGRRVQERYVMMRPLGVWRMTLTHLYVTVWSLGSSPISSQRLSL
jgi:hypothetical protein